MPTRRRACARSPPPRRASPCTADPTTRWRCARACCPSDSPTAGELPRGVGWVIAQFLTAFTCVGRFDEAEQLLVPLRDAAIVEGDDEIVSSGSLVLARLALTRGDLEAAGAFLREGVAALRGYDPAGYLPWCLGMMAQVAGQRGDAAAARDALAELDTITWQVHLYDHDVIQGQAWAAAADGEVTEPVTILLDGRGGRARRGQRLHRRPDAARGVAARRAPARRRRAHRGELRDRASCRTTRCFAAHARALIADDGAALDEVAASFEGFGFLLIAAEAAAEAAAAHRRAGHRASRHPRRGERRPAAGPLRRCAHARRWRSWRRCPSSRDASARSATSPAGSSRTRRSPSGSGSASGPSRATCCGR